MVDDIYFMREYAGELRPYVHVRFGINALIQRQAFYHLVNYGTLIKTIKGETILELKVFVICSLLAHLRFKL